MTRDPCRSFVFRAISVLGLIACCVDATAESPAAAKVDRDENAQHDMLLLLPAGPVHVRAQIMDKGVPLQQMRQDYLAKLTKTLDVDQDGKVSRSEATMHPLFVSSRRFEGNAFLNSLRSRRPFSNREIELAVDRTAGLLVTYRQNNALADQDLNVFGVLDSDASGLIERREMRLAPARIAERDRDFDQCITFDEFLNEETDDMRGVAIASINSEPPGAVHSELLRNANEVTLAARLVRRYDADQDAHLTAGELSWREDRFSRLDSDADNKLSMQELGKLSASQPDVSLRVDFSKDSSEAMMLVGEPPEDVELARSDLVRLRRGSLSLSVGYRHRDPMAEARQNASAAFNAIDVDANGYLDREEIAEHQRFERYLFDAMDRDEDDRVFAEEMLTYVEQYTEPASTTCQVTLLDSGNGFFQMLDANADGRISIRELRQCEQSLQDVAAGESVINPSKLKTSYRIEIQRGGTGLFGRVDRPSAEAPAALLKPPSGPMWFQRMDRNGDGDLTWDEFLGPRDVFDQLDIDHDDLIEESEAKKASETT